jgi:hypothetical protein
MAMQEEMKRFASALKYVVLLFPMLCLEVEPGTAQSASLVGAAPRETLRSSVCRYHRAVPPGDKFSLMTIPTPGRVNESGVVMLVNCSGRKIVSLRDPSHSPRHERRLVYGPLRRAQLPHDPNAYEILNFNKQASNTAFDHTTYSKQQGWTGPCVFDGLELTTADPLEPTDQQTVTIALNICTSHILVLLAPPAAVR